MLFTLVYWCRLRVHSEATKALHAVKAAANTDAIIISDANSVFIDCILQECGVADVFRTVLTNPATFSSGGQLSVAWHHTHHCQRCSGTPNMCKGGNPKDCLRILFHVCFPLGTILRGYLEISSEEYSKVVYVGDGRNDLCPLLQLNSGDVGIVRKGYSLEKALARGSHDVKATIRIVDFLHELGNVITTQCS